VVPDLPCDGIWGAPATVPAGLAAALPNRQAESRCNHAVHQCDAWLAAASPAPRSPARLAVSCASYGRRLAACIISNARSQPYTSTVNPLTRPHTALPAASCGAVSARLCAGSYRSLVPRSMGTPIIPKKISTVQWRTAPKWRYEV
jgi:hypothetical protein